MADGVSRVTTVRDTHAGAWTSFPDLEMYKQTRLTTSEQGGTLLHAPQSPGSDDDDDH